jgi:mutator protein MutT
MVRLSLKMSNLEQNRAAFLAVLNQGKILLVKSNTQQKFKDKWSLPGGVIEHGEGYEDGAVREVLEETGIVARVGECFKTLGKDTNLQVKLFRADYISGEIEVDASEITEAGWFNPQDLSGIELAYTLSEDLRSAGLL